MVIRPPPRRVPHTLELLHGYTLPPHWRARRRQTMAQIKKKAPNKSISPIFSLVVSLLCFRSGFLKKKKTVAIAMPPRGRLIQNCSAVRTHCQGVEFSCCTYTPPPGQAIRKRPAQDWSYYRRYAKHAGQQGNVNCPFPKRDREADDSHGS